MSGANSSTYTPSTVGTYYVEVRTGSGKKTKSIGKTIKEQIKPTVTISGSSAWTNKSVKITSTIKNPGTVKINGYKWYRDNSEISGSNSKDYTANSGGNYKVIVSTDVGNVTSGTVRINIDKTPPSIPTLTHKIGNSNYSLGTWTNKSVKRTIKSDDGSGSGISHFEYTNNTSMCGKSDGSGKLERVNTSTIQNKKEYSINELTASQTNKACFRAVDKAGNASRWSQLYTVLIDKIPPYTPNISSSKMSKIYSDSYWCGYGNEIIKEGNGIGLKYSTNAKHVFCSIYVKENLDLGVSTKDDNSGVDYCEVVWKPYTGGTTYGSYNGFSWSTDDESLKSIGNYNSIKWINDKNTYKTASQAVLFAKRCYDKAGNISPSLIIAVLQDNANDAASLEWLYWVAGKRW